MFDTESKCIEYIHSLSKFGKKAGLANISEILKRLGNPQNRLKFIHIAGTNGKGSVSCMINNILISHGYKVGYYTSPYIEFFNERICINNNPISADKLMEYTSRVALVMEGLAPIEFEFITAIAMLYFVDEGCDVVVLEVGLGGRCDATNVISTPLLSVITPIGLDHTAILGNTISEVAFEKAGIIKTDSKVVISPDMHSDAIDVIRNKCVEMNSDLIIPDIKPCNIKYDFDFTRFIYDNLSIELSLKGKYQLSNAICAIDAARALKNELGITDRDIISGLKNSHWKCRFEIFEQNPVIVLDGAHNSHGIRALMESVDLYFGDKKKIFVFSMLNEKDYYESTELIKAYADYIYATSVPNLRQTDAYAIYNEIIKDFTCCEYEPDPELAFDKARNKAKNDGSIVFVFGSLYLSGMIRQYVK